MLDKDNKLCNVQCRVLTDRNKELVDKDNFQEDLQTRVVELTTHENEWKNKYEDMKNDYSRILEQNINAMNDEKLANCLRDDAKRELRPFSCSSFQWSVPSARSYDFASSCL